VVSSVDAATLTVDTLADTTGAGCPPGSCSLRRAINAAASGDTITFSVTGTITLNSGPLFIDKNLIISGPGPSSLTVSGNNATQVFTIGTFGSPTPSTVTISGLTIGGGSTTFSGGGLDVSAGTVTLTNTTVTNNAAGAGAGINNNGTLTLNGATISGNSASGSGATGGGILNRNTGTLTINNSVISSNTATGGSGGGISNSGTLTVADSVISGNTAAASGSGGGVSATGATTIRRVFFQNNSGGAVFFSAASAAIPPFLIEDSTLVNNTCTCDGSAVRALLGTVNLSSDTIANNTAAPGFGAVFSASAFGGGTVDFRNTILAGNSGPNLSPPNVGAPRFTSQGYNLSSDSSTSQVFTNTGDQNNTNPLLGPLGPCGAGLALFPLPGSPAIGTGSSGLPTDQCGNPRGAPDTKGAAFVPGSAAATATRTATTSPTPTATATATATNPVVGPPSNTPPPSVTLTPSVTPTQTPTVPPNSADLTIEKSGSGTITVRPGVPDSRRGTYSVTVRNRGPATATNLRVTEGRLQHKRGEEAALMVRTRWRARTLMTM
jgi:CSLREA domain-containing protein